MLSVASATATAGFICKGVSYKFCVSKRARCNLLRAETPPGGNVDVAKQSARAETPRETKRISGVRCCAVLVGGRSSLRQTRDDEKNWRHCEKQKLLHMLCSRRLRDIGSRPHKLQHCLLPLRCLLFGHGLPCTGCVSKFVLASIHAHNTILIIGWYS